LQSKQVYEASGLYRTFLGKKSKMLSGELLKSRKELELYIILHGKDPDTLLEYSHRWYYITIGHVKNEKVKNIYDMTQNLIELYVSTCHLS